eukprot:CAMPEP_0196660132 /NCGR_PEP_ID=MMETSP1086-20130531/38225_1 /TAXON_ID=77921 /ORGANISM="Cyanoptyche  gloeocystis , Strain SAG4.97" /LENGTH=274 /DNA_ID=CAMNT_0041994393 /DNA_START=143 /DNA_END=964 /DNA_ORIENTATION=-
MSSARRDSSQASQNAERAYLDSNHREEILAPSLTVVQNRVQRSSPLSLSNHDVTITVQYSEPARQEEGSGVNDVVVTVASSPKWKRGLNADSDRSSQGIEVVTLGDQGCTINGPANAGPVSKAGGRIDLCAGCKQLSARCSCDPDADHKYTIYINPLPTDLQPAGEPLKCSLGKACDKSCKIRRQCSWKFIGESCVECCGATLALICLPCVFIIACVFCREKLKKMQLKMYKTIDRMSRSFVGKGSIGHRAYEVTRGMKKWVMDFPEREGKQFW